ncbi:MAG: phage major capsid protein [Luteolibacter sp.]
MKLTNRFKFRAPWLAIALLGLGFGWATTHTTDHAGTAMALLPMLGLPVRKQDIDNGGGNQNGGGGTLTDDQFKAAVLKSVGEVKTQTETIEGNFRTLDAQSKKLTEDLAEQTKTFTGLPNQVAAVERTLAGIQLKIANERRSNYGSAIERISGDPQLRNAINGIIRSHARIGGMDIPITDEQKTGAADYKRALAEGSGTGASYVNAQLLPEIYALIAEYGIWNTFDVIPVSTSSAKMIVDTTDPVMLIVAENTAPAESSYNGSNVTQTIVKMLGWIAIANELMADSEVDLGRYLLPKFANATAYRLDYLALNSNNGTASTDGGCTGIFNGGTAAVAATTHVSIATLTVDDFINTMAAVNAAALSKPCKWWIHPTNLVRVLGVKDLNGRPIFLPSTDAPSLGAIGSILGYPVVLSHAAPSANTVSSKIAVFGDSMGNGVALRSDFEFAASDQVKFLEDQTVFRARARGATKIKLATAFGVLTNAAS